VRIRGRESLPGLRIAVAALLAIGVASVAASSAWALPSVVYVDASWTGTGDPDGSGPAAAMGVDAFATVQAGVDGVAPGGTVRVAAGTYAEDVSVGKALTLAGAKAGVDARARSGPESVLRSVSFGVSGVTVDGFSFNGSSSQVTVSSSATILSGAVVQNNLFAGFGDVAIPTNNAGSILIRRNRFSAPSSPAEPMQIKANPPAPAGGCSGAQVLDNSFVEATTNGSADVNFSCGAGASSGVTIAGNTSVESDAQGPSFAAFDGITGDLSVSNNTATTNGSTLYFFGGVTGAVTIEANTFAAGPGSAAVGLHGVNSGVFTVTGNTLSGAIGGISVPSGSVVAPGKVVAHGNDFSGSSVKVVNGSSPTLDAAANWWGDVAGPGVLSGIVTSPWCTAAGCATLSNDPSLTALSVSGGSLSPAFSASTLSYSASVANATTSVSVNATATPGAMVAVAGGTGLLVGANTVTVTVTSLDLAATRSYVVSVVRAGASSGGGGGAAPAAAVPPSVIAVAPVANAPASVKVEPKQTGAASVAVAPASSAGTGPKPVAISATWPAGTFSTPVTVELAPAPTLSVPTGSTKPPAPTAGGFTASGAVFQLTVTDSSGAPVTTFQAPIVFHVSSAPRGDIPAYSPDGVAWTPMHLLASPTLPAGARDGYYVNADGSIDIFTRHATFFGLVEDAQAPSLLVKAAIGGGRLRLSLRASDNVRVVSFRVKCSGSPAMLTTKSYVVVPARSGTCVARALDGAGNRSVPTTVTMVDRGGIVVDNVAVAAHEQQPGYEWGIASHNHAGAPALTADPQTPLLGTVDGALFFVTAGVAIDEQARLVVSIVDLRTGKKLLLTPSRSRIGNPTRGEAATSLRYRVLVPRTLPLRVALPARFVLPGYRYALQVVARDPQGNTSRLSIRFDG
jgi:hypothetical protein